MTAQVITLSQKRLVKETKKTVTKKAVIKKDDQEDLIEAIIKDVDARHGKHTLSVLTSDSILCNVKDWASSGSVAINRILSGGRGGKRPLIPFGRFTEISGLEASGKSSLLIQIMVSAQKKYNAWCILGDSEEALDVEYAEGLGLDLGRVFHVQAAYMEDLFAKSETIIKSIMERDPDAFIVYAWDSVGASRTRAEVEARAKAAKTRKASKVKQPHAMVAAKVLSENLRWLVDLVSVNNIAFICTNHLYQKIVMFGEGLETYGGGRLKYYSSLRIRLKTVKKIADDSVADVDGEKEIIGQWVKVTTIKNKMNPGFKTGLVPLLHGLGFSDAYLIYHCRAKIASINKNAWITPAGKTVKFSNWQEFLDNVTTHPKYKYLLKEFFSKPIGSVLFKKK